MTTTIRPKDRDAVIQSLRAGVVPRSGQHLIQVGRAREIETLVTDIDRIADGGSAFRVVIGEYGAGKTFFLNLVRAVAMEKKLVVASADLNPDRRLHASGGQARSLYAELMRNLATRTKPDGGALGGIVEKFIATAKTEAKASGQTDGDGTAPEARPAHRTGQRLRLRRRHRRLLPRLRGRQRAAEVRRGSLAARRVLHQDRRQAGARRADHRRRRSGLRPAEADGALRAPGRLLGPARELWTSW